MPNASDAALREATAAWLEGTGLACGRAGSPLYAALLVAAADDLRHGGAASATWSVLAPVTPAPEGSALPLRLMAAVHRLVLEGRAPALAAFYPSVGGGGDPERAWPAFRATLTAHAAVLPDLVRRPCQTNEVGRSAALLGGFLTVARTTGLPLRLLEVGASAGLNLRWDRFRYVHRHGAWGPPDSPVVLDGDSDLPAELLGQPVAVASRRGCDAQPVDPSTREGRLALAAAVWADQTVRFRRLEGALRIAAEVPARVDAAAVGEWLPARLAEPVPGTATVVYHSVVRQYVPDDQRRAMDAALADAAARASRDAPLAWLRMEPEHVIRSEMDVDLTLWPDGGSGRIARVGAHGDPVRWLRWPR